MVWMTKTILVVVLFLSALLWAAEARAEISIGAGVERFSWSEYLSTGERVVSEPGARSVFLSSWIQEKREGPLFGANIKLSNGTVTYNGQEQLTGKSVQTQTTYSDLTIEGNLVFRSLLRSVSGLNLQTSLGLDHWTRNIGGGQVEIYNILFIKIGPSWRPSIDKEGIHMGGGAKYPIYTLEDAYLPNQGYDQNPYLHPGQNFSFYLEGGYRFNSGWELSAYYDTFRFSKSPVELVTKQGTIYYEVWQPESTMDLVGLLLTIHLPEPSSQ